MVTQPPSADAARVLDALTRVYGFDAAQARACVDELGANATVQMCVDALLDGGAQDRGGPALGLVRCAHVREDGMVDIDALSAPRACGDGEACGARRELWTCLSCGTSGCGRYARGCMLAHSASHAACVALSWEDLSVWCYFCKSYVTHEVLERYRERAEALKFRGAGSSA